MKGEERTWLKLVICSVADARMNTALTTGVEVSDLANEYTNHLVEFELQMKQQ